jgi:hypothetical protein
MPNALQRIANMRGWNIVATLATQWVRGEICEPYVRREKPVADFLMEVESQQQRDPGAVDAAKRDKGNPGRALEHAGQSNQFAHDEIAD